MDLMERRQAFGRWLQSCRKQARITQAELAKALEYDSPQLISNIERGVSLLPSKRLPDFARVFGCSLLEMEVRYFQCSARNSSESRMPDLLLKYLSLIELLEYGSAEDTHLLAAVRDIRQGRRTNTLLTGKSPSNAVGDSGDVDDARDDTDDEAAGAVS